MPTGSCQKNTVTRGHYLKFSKHVKSEYINLINKPALKIWGRLIYYLSYVRIEYHLLFYYQRFTVGHKKLFWIERYICNLIIFIENKLKIHFSHSEITFINNFAAIIQYFRIMKYTI